MLTFVSSPPRPPRPHMAAAAAGGLAALLALRACSCPLHASRPGIWQRLARQRPLAVALLRGGASPRQSGFAQHGGLRGLAGQQPS